MIDAGIVVAISAFAAFGSGSQRWSGFNSPDSEFYASLALFGDEVTDRAIEPAYQWTRLGYIAPVRLLVSTMDPMIGFAVWRVILILIVVGALYSIVRLVSTRQLATLAAILAALNSVVLSFVSNTYLTGTIIAATALLIALGAWGVLGAPRWPWLPALLSGAVAGWLVMLNPYALMLGLSMWIGLRAVGLATEPRARWRTLGRDTLLAVLGFAVVVGGFLASGLAIFPGRDWLRTYLDWNSRLDYASFIGDRDVWHRDIALLLPVAAILMALVAVLIVRRSRAAIAAIVISVTNVAFTAVYFALVPGPWLEAPTYVAKLWPGALIAIALALAAVVGTRRLGWLGWILGAAIVPVVIWAGRWDSTVSITMGIVIGLVMVAAFASTAMLASRTGTRVFAVSVVATLAITAIGAQVLQNGRGQLGTYGQFPFRAAYVDFDAEALIRSKVAAEQFVLDRTTPQDSIGIWTDPDRLLAAVAAMQMWGTYNNVSAGATLVATEARALDATRPTVIAMYAPTRTQIDTFWDSLPPWSRPSDPDCTTVPYLGIGSPDAHVCITHLRWLD